MTNEEKRNIYNNIQNLYNMDFTTWQEVIAMLYNLVSDIEQKFEAFEQKFELMLGKEVTEAIKKMYEDGTLAEIINKEVFTDLNNKIDEVEADILMTLTDYMRENTKKLEVINEQLEEIENKFELFKNNNGCISFSELGGIKNNSEIDNGKKLIEAMTYCASNNKILVLDGKFNISSSIVYNGVYALMILGSCPNHNSLLTTTNTFSQENTNLYFSNGATLEINKLGSVTFFGVGFSSTSREYGSGILLKSFANKFINCKFNQFYKAISAESGAKNWLGENKILYSNFYNCEYCYHATDGSDSEFIGNLIHGSCGVGFFGSCAGYTISLNHFYGKKSNEFNFFNTIISDNYIQEIDNIPSIILNGSFGCQVVNNKFELNSAEPRTNKKSLIEIKTWSGGGNILIDGNNVHGKSLAKVANLSFIDFTSRDNNGVKDMPITIGTNGIANCESYFKNNYPSYNIKGTISYPIETLGVLGGTLAEHKTQVVNGICYFWVKFSSLPNYADIIKMPNFDGMEYSVSCKLLRKDNSQIENKTIMTTSGKISLSDYAAYSSGEFTGSYPVAHSSDRPISV